MCTRPKKSPKFSTVVRCVYLQTLLRIQIRPFYYFDTDPDPTFHFVADPIVAPAPNQSDAIANMQSLATDTPRLLKVRSATPARILSVPHQ